jgi:hypothetical protein
MNSAHMTGDALTRKIAQVFQPSQEFVVEEKTVAGHALTRSMKKTPR